MARDTLRLPVAVKRFATSTPAKLSGSEGVTLPEPAPTPRLGDADQNDATTMFGLPAGYDDDTQLLGMELQTNEDDTMILQQKAFGANQAHLPGIGLGERLFEMLIQPQQQQAPAASNALEVSKALDLGSSLVGRTPQRAQSRKMRAGSLSSAQKRNLRTSIGAGGQTYVDCELDVRFGDDIIIEEAEATMHQEQAEATQPLNKPTARKIDWISQIKSFDKKSLSVVKPSDAPHGKASTPALAASHATLETAEDVFQVAFSEPYRDTHSTSGSSSPPPPAAPSSNRKTPSKELRKRRQSIMSSSPAHFQQHAAQVVDNAHIQAVLRRSPRKSHQGPQASGMAAQTAPETSATEVVRVSPIPTADEEGEEPAAVLDAQGPPEQVSEAPALRRSPRKSIGARGSLGAAQEAALRQSLPAPKASTSRLPQQARKSLPATQSVAVVTDTQPKMNLQGDKGTRESISKRREIRKAKRAQALPTASTSTIAAPVAPSLDLQTVRTSPKGLQTSDHDADVFAEVNVPPTGATDKPDEDSIPSPPAREPLSDEEEQESVPIVPTKSPFPVFRRLDPLSPVIEDCEREREKEMSMERSLLMQRALTMQAHRQSEPQVPEPCLVDEDDGADGEVEVQQQEEQVALLPGIFGTIEERTRASEARLSSALETEGHDRGMSKHSIEVERPAVHIYTLVVPFPTAANTSDFQFPDVDPERPAAAPQAQIVSQAPSTQPSNSLVPVAAPVQASRPVSRQAERPRSRQSTASSQARAKTKVKPYERPKPLRTQSAHQQPAAVSRSVQPVASTSRLPAKAMALEPPLARHTQLHTEQPRGRSRNISVPVNFSPGQKKRPKPSVSRQASVDDMFSRRQRDGSRGRSLETASQAGSTTSSRRARSETARSTTASNLVGPAPSQAHLSVQDKQKRGLLTEPKSFTFSSTSASTKRKRGADMQTASSSHQSIGVVAAVQPRKAIRSVVPVKSQQANAMAIRCQAEADAQEDERVVPLTMQALQAHDILEKSIEEVRLPDQSFSAAEHNKTTKSQTVLRYLKQLEDNRSEADQGADGSEHSGHSAAEIDDAEHLSVAAIEQQVREQPLQAPHMQSHPIIVQEEVKAADATEPETLPTKAKRARLSGSHNSAKQPKAAQGDATSAIKHTVDVQVLRPSRQPVQLPKERSQQQRERTRRSPRKGQAKVAETTKQHQPVLPAAKAQPTQPQPFTFMSVGKEQASFQERLRTWQEREETASKNGRRALQPLAPASGLQNTQGSQASRKNASRQQKQPLEVRPFAFPSDKRMEERREWEERLRAKERIKAELAAIERAEAEAREAAEIKEMRRNQIIRANPLPAYITEKRTVH